MQRKNNKKRIDEQLYKEIYGIVKSLIEDKIEELFGRRDQLEEIKEVLLQIAQNQRKTEETIGKLSEAQKRTEERVSKLEDIVRELAEAQKRTEERVNELAEAQKRTEERVSKLEDIVRELAEAQKRTEERVSKLEDIVRELAEAQKRTEERVNELAEAQKRTEIEIQNLIRSDHEIREELRSIRREIGGLSRSFSYAFENEAFRSLPDFLKKNFGIVLKKRLVREEIRGKEINIFGIGEKEGKEVFVVGEAKVRLDEVKAQDGVFDELEDKVSAVKEEYGQGIDVVKILVTHHATKGFINLAKQRGIIVIQSFEW